MNILLFFILLNLIYCDKIANSQLFIILNSPTGIYLLIISNNFTITKSIGIF